MSVGHYNLPHRAGTGHAVPDLKVDHENDRAPTLFLMPIWRFFTIAPLRIARLRADR
jgi:hypothetical protein